MSETRAIALEQLARANVGEGPCPQPLCPRCIGGRLHPYRVSVSVNYQDAEWLEGWVMVCVGNDTYRRETAKAYNEDINDPGSDTYTPPVEPCGFSMPMTPRRYTHRGG
jgi:hypothetical protein